MLFMAHYLMLTLIILSTLITISSNSSPLTAWLGLEFNSLSFIPLMKNKNNLSSHESMIKYFLIQSIASSLFLVSSLLLHHLSFNASSASLMPLTLMMSLSLLMKLALAPLHFWLFPLINSISWLSFMILTTWQKIAPLSILFYIPSKMMVISIMFSTVLPPISMMNQNSMKMILAYSSIIHTAWMAMINLTALPLLYLYFLVYIMNIAPLFYIFFYWNIFHLSQTTNYPSNIKFLVFLISLSLSGFPPMIMFLMKITTLYQLLQTYSFYSLAILLLLSSLASTYTYIYINFPVLMKSKQLMPKAPSMKLNSSFYALYLLTSILSTPILFTLFT